MAATQRKRKHEYLSRLPREVPAGQILTHNRSRPSRMLIGQGSFRAWLEPAGTAEREVCPCGWAPGVPVHYRVRKAA